MANGAKPPRGASSRANGFVKSRTIQKESQSSSLLVHTPSLSLSLSRPHHLCKTHLVVSIVYKHKIATDDGTIDPPPSKLPTIS